MVKKVFCSSLLICWFTSVSQNKISDILNYDEEVEKISIAAEELAYVETGSGEKTLLFVHGLSSNLEAWSKNISELKQNYKCIAVDLPGYGKSSKKDSIYSLSDYAGFLNNFVIKKGLTNVVLIGHSMGGQIAIHALLNNPENYEELILIAPAGIETFTAQEAVVMKSSYTPELVESSTPEQIRNNFIMNFHSFPADAEFMVEDRIAIREAEDFWIYARTVVNNISAMLNEPVIDRLSEIQIPVLMIYGKNDLLIPNKYFHPSQSIESLVKDAEERIQNLEVVLIEEAGHFVNFEKSSRVNEEIESFLKKQ